MKIFLVSLIFLLIRDRIAKAIYSFCVLIVSTFVLFT